MTRSPRLISLAAIALIVIAGYLAFGPGDGRTITAYFSQTKGIYQGDAVTLLGVRVGTVTDIEPGREQVKVSMRLDEDVDLPADVRAGLVAKSLVSVRAIALGPVYSTGPKLQDGATIPATRTLVPVEWDQVKTELTRLSTALGPNGENKEGALSDIVSSSADFLRGNGASMNTTIRALADAMTTLSDNGGEIFATVRNLQVFVDALEASDTQVRSFNTNLATVSDALASDRDALSGSLEGLRVAFVEVQKFLRDNQDLSASALQELRATTSVFAENRQTIADLLLLAPTTISNFYNIIDPRNGAATGALAFENLSAPAQIVCAAILNLGGPPSDCEKTLGPLVDVLGLNGLPTGVIPPLGVPSLPGGTGTTSESDPLGLSGLLGLLGGK